MAITDSCAAPDQSAPLPASVDLTQDTVIAGTVVAAGEPVSGAYVRLLDASGEFVAEVVSSTEGAFRFYAAPGQWTVRALSRAGSGGVEVSASQGLNEVRVEVSH